MSGYAARVPTLIARLVILFAVLLMPLEMNSAAAAHHAESAAMPMGHCDKQAPDHDMKGGFAECTMACAGALPAAELAAAEPPAIRPAPAQPAVAHQLHGLHPETATPPPKPS